jgi:hypothetical protein
MGYAFGDGKFWIDPNDVENIIKDDNYQRVPVLDMKAGDIVLFGKDKTWKEKGNKIYHAEVVSSVKHYNDGTISVKIKGKMGIDAQEEHQFTGPRAKGESASIWRGNKNSQKNPNIQAVLGNDRWQQPDGTWE